MMLDEESVNGKFKVHTPEWRSAEFNTFLNDLDSRAAAINDKSHPRIQRLQGTPAKCSPPDNVDEWMVNEDDCNSESA